MNSLYRCQASVAYKPPGENKVVVIPERQIDSVSVSLEQNVSGVNRTTTGGISNIYSAGGGNKCEVVINDPYMDGVSWITLEDIASSRAGGASYLKNNALLPKCEKGQDPETTPCYALYQELDSSSITGQSNDPAGFSRPWLIISLFYDIPGVGITEFQTFFRVINVSIQHGGQAPKITIRGEGAVSVQFNQQYNQIFLEKDKSLIEELNEKIFKKQGYELQNVCGGAGDERKLEKSYRINGLNPIQILKKHIDENNVGEVYISEKAEDAKIIQICERTDFSCNVSRVFYLGKGLYEQYSINAAFTVNPAELNTSRPGQPTGDDSVLPGETGIVAGSFNVSVKYPETKAKQVSDVEKADPIAFKDGEKQFQDNKDYYTSTSADGWKGTAGGSNKFSIVKLIKKYPYEKARNAKATLGGVVTRVSKDEGLVLIQSKFSIHLDSASGGSASKDYLVYQEFRNLKSISVTEDTSKVLKYGETVGELETDPNKETVTRFFISPGKNNTAAITIPRSSLKPLISPVKRLDDKDKEDTAPSSGADGKDVVGWVGSTGKSTGPHIHAEIRPLKSGGYGGQTVVASDFDPYITVGGKKPSEWVTTSGHKNVPNGRPGHGGVDIGGTNILGQPIRIINGTLIERGSQPGGYGNYVAIDIGGGKEVFLGHLLNAAEGSIARERYITETGASVSRGGFSGSPILDEKSSLKLTTKFKGVPRSLYLEPGKTVLSFISDYDAWLKANKNELEVEPGVWIPDAYRNWLVRKTTWKWEKGDLRMELEALRPYHYGGDWDKSLPTFKKYTESYPYKDYYDYIRSPSDLCYVNTRGENSCAKCGKNAANVTSGGSASPDISSTRPNGPYTYNCNNSIQNKAQSLLNAGHDLGVTNKWGLAAMIGSAQQESGASIDPTIVSGVPGESSQGIYQWNPAPNVLRLQELESYAQSNNLDPLAFETQVNFFVKDVEENYSGLVPALNSANSAWEAANAFDKNYTISGDRDAGPDSANNVKRTQYTTDAFNCMSP